MSKKPTYDDLLSLLRKVADRGNISAGTDSTGHEMVKMRRALLVAVRDTVEAHDIAVKTTKDFEALLDTLCAADMGD